MAAKHGAAPLSHASAREWTGGPMPMSLPAEADPWRTVNRTRDKRSRRLEIGGLPAVGLGGIG